MARTKNVSGPTAGSGGSPGGDGGGDPPRRLSAVEKGKGKKLATKKRKASDRDGEVTEAVAAAAEVAERGGRSGALKIGDDLTPWQRRAVLETEAFHGSPPGTVTIGGQRIRFVVRDSAQGDPDTKTEAQAEGPAEGQEQEQPLRRSTRARTQATPRTGTQGQSTSTARATPAKGTQFMTEASPDPQGSHSRVSQRDPTTAVRSVSYVVSSCQGSQSRCQVLHSSLGGHLRGTGSLSVTV